MKRVSTTPQRVVKYLEQMQKAMPEIRRQVSVYEKCIATESHSKVPKLENA